MSGITPEQAAQFKSVGNASFMRDAQFNGNVTHLGNLQINGNTTNLGNIQLNGSQTTLGHQQINGTIVVGDNMFVGGAGVFGNVSADQVAGARRLMATDKPDTNPNDFVVQEVRFYEIGIPGQPGLVLKGTDGVNYLLFIDTSGGVGNPNIGIQKA